MRYITLVEVIDLHRRIIAATGGAQGIRDLGRLEASVARPRHTFGGDDLYPTLLDKAAALGFALIQNHFSCFSMLSDLAGVEWILGLGSRSRVVKMLVTPEMPEKQGERPMFGPHDAEQAARPAERSAPPSMISTI